MNTIDFKTFYHHLSKWQMVYICYKLHGWSRKWTTLFSVHTFKSFHKGTARWDLHETNTFIVYTFGCLETLQSKGAASYLDIFYVASTSDNSHPQLRKMPRDCKSNACGTSRNQNNTITQVSSHLREPAK